MFIELLIVFGILGVISAITVVAVNLGRHLCEVRNAKRQVNARELTNAVNQYAIRAGQPASGDIPDGAANAAPVCRLGATGSGNCVSLDVLVPEYVIAPPVVLDRVVPGHLEDCDPGS